MVDGLNIKMKLREIIYTIHLLIFVPQSCSGCPEFTAFCWFCLQAGGGERAGAVAKVVAAVDVARTREPVHVEGGRIEEQKVEAVEVGLRQQAAATVDDHQYRTGWTPSRMQAGQMLSAAQEFTADLHTQVRKTSEQTRFYSECSNKQSFRSLLANHLVNSNSRGFSETF